ncbi:phosphoribosylanthranilate isomerase [Prevotellaceae bacterium HUN156]|nr:phosphoribosylanthranilate isomerase [Prevotellaceae bacterium HUN156]
MIKVCGMREPNNIRAVEALGIDWIGLIFWSGSSRYVAEPPSYLPIRAKRVGVFVDASIDDILRHVIEYRLDVIQLHGHETPDHIQNLRAVFHAPHHDDCNCPTCKSLATKPLLIKALPIATKEDLSSANVYDGLVDYFLFDTKDSASLPGGTGCQFDWSILADYRGDTSFLLSGGIGPNDAQRLREFHHPLLAGIDLNSRFEQSPALKDITKLKAFLYEYNQ